TVSVMSCTCAKASQTGTHEHYFLQCDLFRALPVGRALVLQHEGGTVEGLADVARGEGEGEG
ncbi:MAG: hypothetical protein ACT4R6_00950, partial [Gemmatimonadaceae bacterium]